VTLGSSSNTYTGGTTVNRGTLTLGSTATLGATTGTLAVNNTNTGPGTASVLNLATGANNTVGSLSGTIAVPSSGVNTATINTQAARTFTVNQTVAGTFAGNIAGSGSFTLGSLSTQALTLTGENTISGGTSVVAGALIVNGSLSNASNAVQVGANGALGGDGSIAGSITFASGADLIFNPTATLDVTNSVSFANFSVANLLGLDSSVANNRYVLLNSIGGSISQTNVANIGIGAAAPLGGGKIAYFDFTDGDLAVNVSAIPEPSAFAALAGLAALGFVGSRRRRAV
jgi:autotransporter-associated beta strand protein